MVYACLFDRVRAMGSLGTPPLRLTRSPSLGNCTLKCWWPRTSQLSLRDFWIKSQEEASSSQALSSCLLPFYLMTGKPEHGETIIQFLLGLGSSWQAGKEGWLLKGDIFIGEFLSITTWEEGKGKETHTLLDFFPFIPSASTSTYQKSWQPGHWTGLPALV